jgi:hypothetical protein
VHLWPDREASDTELWTAEWATKVRAASTARMTASPLFAVAMPAASIAVLGWLPPALCAALAARIVVSH